MLEPITISLNTTPDKPYYEVISTDDADFSLEQVKQITDRMVKENWGMLAILVRQVDHLTPFPDYIPVRVWVDGECTKQEVRSHNHPLTEGIEWDRAYLFFIIA